MDQPDAAAAGQVQNENRTGPGPGRRFSTVVKPKPAFCVRRKKKKKCHASNFTLQQQQQQEEWGKKGRGTSALLKKYEEKGAERGLPFLGINGKERMLGFS